MVEFIERWPFAPVILIAGLGLAVRLLLIVDLVDAPTFDVPVVDARVYLDAAGTWASHGGFSEAFFYQPFLYPLFLGVLLKFLGSSLVAVRVAQAALGALSCGLLVAFVNRTVDRRTAITAGVILAICPTVAFFEVQLLGAGLAVVATLVLLWSVTAFAEQPGWRRAVLSGAVAGLAVLARPTFVPVLAAMAMWLIVRWRREPVRAAGRLGLAGIALIAMLGPVALASKSVTGEAGVLPTSGGLNLYLGNNPDRCKTLTMRPGMQWDELVTEPMRHGARSPWEQHRYFRKKVTRYLALQPLDALRGWIEKTGQFFSAREIPRNVDIYAYRQWSPMLRASVWKRPGGFGFPFGFLLPLAVVGLGWSWRKVPTAVLLYVAAFPLSVALVFSASRYRAPFMTVVALLAALGIVTLTDWVRMGRWRSVVAASLVMIVIGAASSVAGPFCQEEDLGAELQYLVGGELLLRGEAARAETHLRRATERDPERFESRMALGVVLLESQRPAEAERHLEVAVALEPGRAEAWRELARSRLMGGDEKGGAAALRRVVEIDPHDAESMANLGTAELRLGRVGSAQHWLRRALEVDPGLENARINLEIAGRVSANPRSPGP